ncbi:glutathione S-transferase family protein [Lusitaniella coriacea]|uniref:glutathione S-transferase family protein n=1 Tax=Lusitaniella coriacea TaxID=1983105 RepID=UPI003CF87C8E
MAQLILVIGNKNYSSWSLRPWLAMKQAGLDFTEVRIPLDLPNSLQEIQRYSPTGKVPILVHDDLTIWESIAICEYIVDYFAPELLPRDRAARAIARSISAEMHAGFHNLRQGMPMDCRSRYPNEGITLEVQADIERIKKLWQECRNQFGGKGKFLFGDFTIADAMFAPVISRFATYGVQLDPVGQDYAEAIWSLPAMQEWIDIASQETETIADLHSIQLLDG